MAGREGFEPSRELYTPYPLSRRVLSATQPPPRGVNASSFDSIGRDCSPYLTPDGGSRRTRRAAHVGSRPQDGVWSGARFEEQALVHARGWFAQRSFLSVSRSGRTSR